MSTTALVKLRILFYSTWALLNAWCTGMAGVRWSDMTWEAQSCLIGGIIMSWSGMMVAYFDKSVWRMDAEKQANGNGVDKNAKPPDAPQV